MGKSVNVGTVALILPRCKKLASLTMCFAYRHISCAIRNPLYRPLLELTDLKYLNIGLTTLHTNHMVSLSKIEFFNYPTHLHLLSSGSASISIPTGFAKLVRLTHLGMSWTIGQSCNSDLQQFLRKSSTVVLIQWYDKHHSRSEVEKNLQDQELVDQRIVLLGDHENNEDAWELAECIVRWRVENKSKDTHLHLITIDRSFVGDTFATSKASELVDSVVVVSG